jgi:DNA (cytosine-5)-methyltransferase 1
MKAIDLFAGAGGSSEGARAAGVRVVWAANHCPIAVRVHAANHPETAHACQDLQQADFRAVPDADIILASPACQGHSQAASGGGRYKHRGTAPKHDSDRSTAWAVVTAAEVIRPPLVVVENVPEFRSWVLYGAWTAAMRSLGYTLAEHVIDAADCGVPQRRERLILTAVRSASPLVLRLPKREHVAIGSVIDLDAGEWKPVRTLPPAARARVERSRARHPRGAFLAHYVSDDMGHSLDAPMRSVTTKHQWAVVKRSRGGDVRRMFTSEEYAGAMGFPRGYRATGMVTHDCRLFGNAVPPPLMTAVLRAAGC